MENIYMSEEYSCSGKQYNNEKAIISLTTWKKRIDEVSKTLFSLLRMCEDFHIVLVLYKDEFPEREEELPDELKLFINNNLIEVLWADENLRPHLKYFYTMQKYRNVPVITCDDDQIVFKNFAEILYESYLKNPNVIHACRCHRIMKSDDMVVLPYRKWKWNCKNISKPSFELFATGVGTVLYPPNILKLTNADLPLIKDILCQDDIFLKIKENLLGIKVQFVNGVSLGRDLKEIHSMQEDALNKINTMNQNLNDVYITKYNNLLSWCE